MTPESKKPPTSAEAPGEDPVRPHVFDGIQEYDKRLPNWWLATFYLTIVFAVGYWIYTQQSGLAKTDGQKIAAHMAEVEAVKLAGAASLDESALWKMSQNAVIVDAGKATFNATCASCHQVNLTGGIGPSLVDNVWLHGNRASDVLHTVANGVPAKGMPGWGAVLGTRKVSEVVAYVLSHHQPPASGEAPAGN